MEAHPRYYTPTSRGLMSTLQYTSVANNFNVYFTSMGQRTVETVKELSSDFNAAMMPTVSPPNISTLEQFHFAHITTADLEECILKMPGNKSPGADKIPVKILKDCLAANISMPLTNIINQSFETCTFPENGNLAEVIPHVKEGDHELAGNNRPISLIQSAGKICERIAL